MRKHEPLNRFITTPIFDKNSSSRTLSGGKAYYRPKRDTNGIIMCRSQKDQEACIFADNVRNLRQHEYDNQALYTDTDAEQAAQNERSRCDFIKYFEEENRPQVKADVDRDKGMGISIGRLREDTVYDYKFVGLSHNTVRGAAGGAVLCAETLKAKGYIGKKF